MAHLTSYVNLTPRVAGRMGPSIHSRPASPCYNCLAMNSLTVFFATTLLLVACAAPAEPEQDAQATVAGPSEIQVFVASDDFAVGAPRVPFVLYSGPDQVAGAKSVQITAFDLSSDSAIAEWSGEAINYSDFENSTSARQALSSGKPPSTIFIDHHGGLARP